MRKEKTPPAIGWRVLMLCSQVRQNWNQFRLRSGGAHVSNKEWHVPRTLSNYWHCLAQSSSSSLSRGAIVSKRFVLLGTMRRAHRTKDVSMLSFITPRRKTERLRFFLGNFMTLELLWNKLCFQSPMIHGALACRLERYYTDSKETLISCEKSL